MNYLYLILFTAALTSAGVPVEGVGGQNHETTIANAIAAHQRPGWPRPVSAGYNGEGRPLSGWTQSGPRRYTKPGRFDADRTAGAEVSNTKASAGIAHPFDRAGGYSWAQGPKAKVSARIEPGGRADLTITQPNGEVLRDQIHGQSNRMRISRSKMVPVLDNKQTRTYTSNVPGKQVHVKAQFTNGKGGIKSKAFHR